MEDKLEGITERPDGIKHEEAMKMSGHGRLRRKTGESRHNNRRENRTVGFAAREGGCMNCRWGLATNNGHAAEASAS